MHATNLLYLWGMCNAFAHALTILHISNDALVERDGRSVEGHLPADILKRASPPAAKFNADPKPPAKPPKPVPKPPTTPPKPAPEPPAAPPKPDPKPPVTSPRPVPKPPVKPPKPVPKPPVNTPKPTPAPSSKPAPWPHTKVPYVTTAVDTCGLFVECDEALIEKENADIVAPGIIITRHTEAVKNAGISIKNLDYPGAPDLFTPRRGANVKENVFDFNSEDMKDYKVKNLGGKPASYDRYVTEHIIELQTIMMFINSIIGNDAKKKSFFVDWWNKALDATEVADRPNKPSITMGDQVTLNNLVFEALGSNNNRDDFVLCEEEINGYKARIWNRKAPIGAARYKNAECKPRHTRYPLLADTIQTLAVFEYLNNPEVTSRLQAAIKNVGTELSNIEPLTKQSMDLAKEWPEFMTSHFTAVEKAAKQWFSDRIVKDTEKQIAAMISTLEKTEKELMAKEKGQDAQKHAEKAKVESERIEKEIVKAQAAVDSAERDVKAKEKDLKDKRDEYNKINREFRRKSEELAALEKQIAKERDQKNKAELENTRGALAKEVEKLEDQKNKAENDRTDAETARDNAKAQKLSKDKAVGLKKREKWLLRSVELRDVINGLEKDKKAVADFKDAGAQIKMPSIV
ncbi:hypothetical protein SVAN01_10293 [Stagonosporopsis vannaccii]|nr:hypothetical protein SVAN01_10293 [Stagonosporopsis vannaccii]